MDTEPMTFDQRLQHVSDLLNGCVASIELLLPSAESSMEQQYYVKVALRLRILALDRDPDALPEKLREHYFDMVLLQAELTRERFLELAAEERFEQNGKNRKISPHNLQKLFKRQTGRKGLSEDWRDAGKLVLSQKLGPGYDDVLTFIFFPETQ